MGGSLLTRFPPNSPKGGGPSAQHSSLSDTKTEDRTRLVTSLILPKKGDRTRLVIACFTTLRRVQRASLPGPFSQRNREKRGPLRIILSGITGEERPLCASFSPNNGRREASLRSILPTHHGIPRGVHKVGIYQEGYPGVYIGWCIYQVIPRGVHRVVYTGYTPGCI